MTGRLNNLMNKLQKQTESFDAALITSEINRLYFTGFKSSAGLVLVTRDESYFIVDFRYYEAAAKKVKGVKVALGSDFKSELLKLIKKHKIKSILLENAGITLAEVLKFEAWVKDQGVSFIKTSALDDAICLLRSIKTEEEIQNIKTAQEIAERALGKFLPKIKIGMTEKEAAFNLEFLMRKEGAESVAFDIIVASGKNGAVPHAQPSEKKFENGDFITIDIGAVYNGYHSDMTRTVALGHVSERQREVYDLVLQAQSKAIENIKPGVLCKEVDDIARSFIYKNGYEGCFEHALGHGVGLEIHEKPSLSARSKDGLNPGTVVTVEPGIYLNNEFGVRLEDMVLVSAEGAVNLTSAEKNLIIL